ncbi:MAG: ATP-dependent Clp protease proteolytic subunit [Clostridia bacterium]|nr:ATP-dependent Clp protease proteolytic subunit [Clostridia bacterium]
MIPLETKLFCERKLIVEGEITQKTSIEFVKQLLILGLESDKLPIDVLINSEGGEVNSGLLMYDAVQSCTAPVRMFCLNFATSSYFFIDNK